MLKNNLFIKLAALISAIIIWYIIINVDNPVIKVTVKDVPVKIINSESVQNKNKVFSLENNSRVDVLLEGRRTLVSNLTDEDIVAEVDLSKVSIYNTAEIKISLKDEKLDVIIYNPIRLINISVENKIEAPFPVTIVPVGKVIEGYAVSSARAEPSEVKVKGAESLIKKIKEIRGEINVNEMSSDVSEDVKIIAYDEEGRPVKDNVLTLSDNVVKAKAHIGKVKTIPVKLVGLPNPVDGYSVGDMTITPNSVDIIGELIDMARISAIEIDYKNTELGLLKTETITGTVQLEKFIPKEIKITNYVDKVSVQIPISKTQKKNFKLYASDIEIKGLDSNNVTIVENEVEIIVSGTKSVLEKIEKIKDLKPYILFEDISQEEYSIPINFDTELNVDISKVYIRVKIKKENYGKKNGYD